MLSFVQLFSKDKFDWWILVAVVTIMLGGLVTLQSFTGAEEGGFFARQLMFCGIGVTVMFGFSLIDMSVLRRSQVLVWLYGLGLLSLVGLFIFGDVVNGARSWYQLGGFSLQPADPVKLLLVLILAKYLSRRHVALPQTRHLYITMLYFLVPFLLIFAQPDPGSGFVLAAIWFGMILVAGIPWKHLLALVLIGAAASLLAWGFLFQDYQRDRILTFLSPLEDIQGAGYNAYQSTIAVGSGQFAGKGLGFGTQSRLNFLPEHQTDFVFASFSEEWGFIGSIIILGSFAVIVWRIIRLSWRGTSNFETLFGVGVILYLLAHIMVNVGMNIGLMPVTGIPLPFMSYGGSHILTECIALGLILSMYRYRQRLTSRLGNNGSEVLLTG